MKVNTPILIKTLFWGAVTAVIYAGLFYFSDVIIHMAHTTPPACVVVENSQLIYYHKPDVTECLAKGGHIESGAWWHTFIPILLALIISLVHGAFTGLFWEVMGLKPASHSEKH